MQQPEKTSEGVTSENPATFKANSQAEFIVAITESFAAGAKKVDITLSPTSMVVLTRDEFFNVLNGNDVDLSKPLAQRFIDEADKKYSITDEQQKQMSVRLSELLDVAETRYIDATSENAMIGTDVNGNEFDVADKLLYTPNLYPETVKPMHGEVGALIDKELKGPAVRMIDVNQTSVAQQ